MSQSLNAVTLQTATRMAASGQYAAAASLLDLLYPAAHQLEAQLLRAKIAAQQGHYEEAIAYWREALSLSPDNLEAQRGIAMAEQLKARRGGRFYLRASLYYASLGAIIICLVALLAFVLIRNAGRPEAVSAKSALEAEQQQLQLTRELAESLKSIAADKAGHNALKTELDDLKIEVSGITVRDDGDKLSLVFEQGLFEGGGAKIKRDGMALLLEVGSKLQPHLGRISLCVVGHTDNVPVPSRRSPADNMALAMARAVAVVAYLRSAASLPPSVLSARAMGESSTPYSNGTPDGRARNRTVVIEISRMKN